MSDDNWNDLNLLLTRIGCEPATDEQGLLRRATVDDCYHAVLDMEDHEWRCGFYAACEALFPGDPDLIELSHGGGKKNKE